MQCPTALTTILFVCLCLPICMASTIEVKSFDANPGIYFERLGSTGLIKSDWSLVTYVDMQSFWKKLSVIEGYPKALRKTCDKTIPATNCLNTLQLIENLLEEIKSKNQILQALKGYRMKRGAFNIVGNIGNALFGILDSEYAIEAEKTIDKIRKNENYLVEQIQNQTSYLDSTINIMKRSQQNIHGEISKLEKTIHRLEHQHDNDVAIQSISEVALQATLEMLHVERIQDSLLDILADTHHGKISTALIPPHQLQSELIQIKANLPSTLKLPAQTNELLNFYKLMSIEGRVTDGFIIFKIRIPLLSTEAFELLKLTTVPWYANGQFYRIQSKISLLIINLHRDKYLQLRESELDTCVLINTESYLCRQNHPVHKIGSTVASCELQLLSQHANGSSCRVSQTDQGPHFIQLNNPNMWIYSVADEYTLNAVCETSLSKLHLKKSGILKLQGGCTIKQPMVTIQGYQEYVTITHKYYLPSINISEIPHQKQDPVDNMTIPQFSAEQDLEDLRIKMSKLQIKLPNQLGPHDVHHYSISYATLMLVVIVAAALWWTIYKQKPSIVAVNSNEIPSTADQGEDPEEHVITIYG